MYSADQPPSTTYVAKLPPITAPSRMLLEPRTKPSRTCSRLGMRVGWSFQLCASARRRT
jgi:hypothetical protein